MLIDKGCLVNSLFHYPANMTFFTTPELLEIGDIPFPSAHVKPTREEALEYYRKVAEHYRLDVRQYERVDAVSGSDGDFLVRTTTVERRHSGRAGRPGEAPRSPAAAPNTAPASWSSPPATTICPT